MKEGGFKEKEVTYYCEDNGNTSKSFFEDLDCLLHSGEVPNMFGV